MQRVRWKIPSREDRFTHGINPLNSEYTLCGCAFDGSIGETGQSLIETKRRISCPNCIRVIDQCKTVKLSEIRRV